MAMYNKGGILAATAPLFKRYTQEGIQDIYSHHLGVFAERQRKNFVPVVHAPTLRHWVEKHDSDPLDTFPFPLVNLYTWAETQAGRSGIAVVEPRLTAKNGALIGFCREFGYKPFEVYGNNEAAKHLLNSLGVRVKAQGQRHLPPSKRDGPQRLGDLINESLEGLL